MPVIEFFRSFAEIDDHLHGGIGQKLFFGVVNFQVLIKPKILHKMERAERAELSCGRSLPRELRIANIARQGGWDE